MPANTHIHCTVFRCTLLDGFKCYLMQKNTVDVVALTLVIDAHTLRQSVALLMRILHMSDFVLETVGVCRSAVASSLTGTSGATVISSCGQEATCYRAGQIVIVNKQQMK